MRLRLFTTAATAALLALGVPAHASDAVVNCDYNTQDATTDGRYSGTADGYVASTMPGESVSLRCFILVDGVEVASTPTGHGVTAAATAGPIEYAASDTSTVTLCAEYTVGADTDSFCYATAWIGFPPQEVCDAVAEATFGHVEPSCLWW